MSFDFNWLMTSSHSVRKPSIVDEPTGI